MPFVLRRVGADPATSSAPFVATLVDVTGLIIYFSIAPRNHARRDALGPTLRFIQVFDDFLHAADHEGEAIVIELVGCVAR